MSLLKATRVMQYPLQAEFIFNIAADSMLDIVAGVVKVFNAAGPVFEPINLPPNAIVVGGDVTVETVSDDTGTATIAVGDSANAVRYLAATSIKTAARIPLVPTGYRGVGENIRVTLANQNANAANGKVSLRVLYTITGRAQETQLT